ncbi:spore germination protein (amino acid permease) [Paenibacillus sp. 1_12]|uniref:GerAB/ArcD/ProY family transporter n=1 Tax=Paenibacillus sp. 1_12 TaxID=1566278 RepID=UPI0008DEEC4E|nr:GerAB/ArcD/ProY family transporter [Paenibacillus sp. 1_12]SFL22334.1 spore germination protein (amino acid permease) [Paenibacillus sp. 1_12]
MTPSKLQISFNQYVVLQMMIFGGTSFFLYPYFIVQATNESYWMIIVIWMLMGILGAWLYSCMLASHPGTDAFDISKQLFGTVGSLLFNIPMLWFIGSSIVLMIRAHGEMISMTMLHTTPQWFLSGVVFISVFLASGGLISIVRTAGVLVIVSVPISIALTLLGLSDIQIQLGKPWLHINGDFFQQTSFYASSYIWAGFIYFAAAGKYANKPKQLWKSYGLAAICFFPIIIGAVYFPILTFGPELTKSLTFPYITKMDSISHYWLVIENLTAVFVSVSMIYVILTIALMIHCFVVGVRTFFPKWNENLLYMITGVLTYSSALIIPSWNWIEKAVIVATPIRLYVIFVIPLAVLIKYRLQEGKKRHP